MNYLYGLLLFEIIRNLKEDIQNQEKVIQVLEEIISNQEDMTLELWKILKQM